VPKVVTEVGDGCFIHCVDSSGQSVRWSLVELHCLSDFARLSACRRQSVGTIVARVISVGRISSEPYYISQCSPKLGDASALLQNINDSVINTKCPQFFSPIKVLKNALQNVTFGDDNVEFSSRHPSTL
jgi:hypothetical protein